MDNYLNESPQIKKSVKLSLLRGFFYKRKNLAEKKPICKRKCLYA